MARVTMPDMRPWGRRALTIPPDSPGAWMQLAVWELWMGGLIAITAGFGIIFVVMAPARILTKADLSACYGPRPVPIPCDRVVYLTGGLDAAFTALCGLMLIGVAAWFLWELWLAVEPKPITDDFLKLLDDSFGSDWRNPLKWPWGRTLYAYGFAAAGALLTATVAVSLWSAIASSASSKRATAHVETWQDFRIGR